MAINSQGEKNKNNNNKNHTKHFISEVYASGIYEPWILHAYERLVILSMYLDILFQGYF